jgi:hypothetical protein
MTAFRERGAIAPKALGGWRHSKLVNWTRVAGPLEAVS